MSVFCESIGKYRLQLFYWGSYIWIKNLSALFFCKTSGVFFLGSGWNGMPLLALAEEHWKWTARFNNTVSLHFLFEKFERLYFRKQATGVSLLQKYIQLIQCIQMVSWSKLYCLHTLLIFGDVWIFYIRVTFVELCSLLQCLFVFLIPMSHWWPCIVCSVPFALLTYIAEQSLSE